MAAETYRIYALKDPRSGDTRYVGKTTMRPSQRLASHVRAAKAGRDESLKGQWIRDLLGCGVRPEINVILETNRKDWQSVERAEIARMKSEGHDLLNKTDGGNGSHNIDCRFPGDEKTISRLGVWTDSRLAKSLGLTRKAVTYHREKLGIPASFCRDENKPPPPMGGHNKVVIPEEFMHMVGEMPDYKLASKIGCTKGVVARTRREMGIEPYAKRTGNNGRFNGQGSHPRWGTEMQGQIPR